MDSSCYVTIRNSIDTTLTRSEKKATNGYWEPEPADSIAPQGSTTFRLKDYFGFFGAEGSCKYTFTDKEQPSGRTVSIVFGCPFSSNNYVRLEGPGSALYSLTYQAKSDGGHWEYNSCPQHGSPLYVDVTLAYAQINTSAVVTEVKVANGYPMFNGAHKRVPGNQPVWTPSGSYTEGQYSTSPAAVMVGNNKCVSVTMSIDQPLRGVPFVLTGYLGQNKVLESGAVFTTGSEAPVALRPMQSTAAPYQLLGDVTWKLSILGSGQVVSLPGSSRLEIYWIFGQPQSMYTRGVWALMLRDAFEVLPSGASESQATTAIVSRFFNGRTYSLAKQYDCWDGKAWYGTRSIGVYIDLALYLENGPLAKYCNCYDQAGIVQASLGALGLGATWLFILPFGFINTTDLIGWPGNCNNPFFYGESTRMLVGVNDANRTPFFNHAALYGPAGMIDACQGPISSGIAKSQYMSQCVDSSTTLYSKYSPPENRPGTSADMFPTGGILSVESAPPPQIYMDRPQIEAIEALSDFRAVAEAADESAAQVDLDAIGSTVLPGADERYRKLTLAADGVHLLLVLEGGEAALDARIDLFVSSEGHRGAVDRWLEALSSFSAPLDEILVAAPAELPGARVATRGERPTFLWTHHNVFAQVACLEQEGPDASADMTPLALRLDAVLGEGAVPASELAEPEVGEPQVSAEEIALGEQVTVTLEAASALVEPIVYGDALALTAVEGSTATYTGVEPGACRIDFAVADEGSLRVVNRSVEVSVVP